jgi:hypothetical protein
VTFQTGSDSEADTLDAFARAFLGEAPAQATAQDQAALADMLDREYIAPAERRELPEQIA